MDCFGTSNICYLSYVSYSSYFCHTLPENCLKLYKEIGNILNKENKASSTNISFGKRKVI